MQENEPKINRPCRIFCVITQGELGGAQQFIAQLSRNLDPEQLKLHVVWGAESQSALARLLPESTTFATARHLVRGWSPWHDVMSIFELRKQMRTYHPDVVLCISSKAGFVGSRAAHLLRRQFPNLKVIYRIGGWAFNDPRPVWERAFYVALERLSAYWKDYIVVNNTYDLERARILHIKPRRELLCIYNGLDPYMPFLSKEDARTLIHEHMPENLRDKPYEHLIGTVANLYPVKDIGTLIRAAAQTPDTIRFVVIGDGPSRSRLEQLIHKHGLQERFFLLGRMKDAWQYLAGFDVFALSSVKEGFPWALLEAMAARVPCVATRVGAVPEMLEDGESGLLVEPGNAKQLAEGIQKFLEDEKLRQSCTINAHQQVIAKFSFRDMMAQYEKLFTE